jgi:hypothetical protein
MKMRYYNTDTKAMRLYYTFVALDPNGKPRNKSSHRKPEDEIKLFEGALRRRQIRPTLVANETRRCRSTSAIYSNNGNRFLHRHKFFVLSSFASLVYYYSFRREGETNLVAFLKLHTQCNVFSFIASSFTVL